MDQVEKLEERLKEKRKDYRERNYFGNLSDLLADIVNLEVKIYRLKEKLELRSEERS